MMAAEAYASTITAVSSGGKHPIAVGLAVRGRGNTKGLLCLLMAVLVR